MNNGGENGNIGRDTARKRLDEETFLMPVTHSGVSVFLSLLWSIHGAPLPKNRNPPSRHYAAYTSGMPFTRFSSSVFRDVIACSSLAPQVAILHYD